MVMSTQPVARMVRRLEKQINNSFSSVSGTNRLALTMCLLTRHRNRRDSHSMIAGRGRKHVRFTLRDSLFQISPFPRNLDRRISCFCTTRHGHKLVVTKKLEWVPQMSVKFVCLDMSCSTLLPLLDTSHTDNPGLLTSCSFFARLP